MKDNIEEVKKILNTAVKKQRGVNLLIDTLPYVRQIDKYYCQLLPQPLDTRRRFPFSINEAIYLLEKVRAELDMPIETHEYQALSGVIEMLKSPTKPPQKGE